MNILMILSTFVHNLSSILLVGYYLLMTLIFLPVFSRHVRGAALGHLLDDLSGRMLPWIVITIVCFIISGTYLMMANPAYHGVGQFNNLWSIAMLLKHGLVLVMIGLGGYLTLLVKMGLARTTPDAVEFATLKNFKVALICMSSSAVLVLLLTAFAQAQ